MKQYLSMIRPALLWGGCYTLLTPILDKLIILMTVMTQNNLMLSDTIKQMLIQDSAQMIFGVLCLVAYALGRDEMNKQEQQNVGLKPIFISIGILIGIDGLLKATSVMNLLGLKAFTINHVISSVLFQMVIYISVMVGTLVVFFKKLTVEEKRLALKVILLAKSIQCISILKTTLIYLFALDYSVNNRMFIIVQYLTLLVLTLVFIIGASLMLYKRYQGKLTGGPMDGTFYGMTFLALCAQYDLGRLMTSLARIINEWRLGFDTQWTTGNLSVLASGVYWIICLTIGSILFTKPLWRNSFNGSLPGTTFTE